ncbi:MAG: hydroxymethylbilane synthase, partial [Chitinivibrionia bacterium]|nr:hydroxymethylbilane synthase [Chitinivibrionia bacterium]
MSRLIRIGSRKSKLALIQSEEVKTAVERDERFRCEVLGTDTKGDAVLDRPLPAIGDKGLFTRELEQALLDGSIDIAVHSLKDLPTTLPEGLRLGAVTVREDPRDAFLSPRFKSLRDVPQSGCVATGSARRSAQVRKIRPDIVIRDLRGNVPTRIQKMSAHGYDGIILAAAGIKRLDLEETISSYFDTEDMIPAAGQGALGIEVRSGAPDMEPVLAILNDPRSAAETSAERTVLHMLRGGCHVPMGINALTDGRTIRIVAFVSDMRVMQFI